MIYVLNPTIGVCQFSLKVLNWQIGTDRLNVLFTKIKILIILLDFRLILSHFPSTASDVWLLQKTIRYLCSMSKTGPSNGNFTAKSTASKIYVSPKIAKIVFIPLIKSMTIFDIKSRDFYSIFQNYIGASVLSL